jgi:hypothetical protein
MGELVVSKNQRTRGVEWGRNVMVMVSPVMKNG